MYLALVSQLSAPSSSSALVHEHRVQARLKRHLPSSLFFSITEEGKGVINGDRAKGYTTDQLLLS
jgi:hypothetical protein